MFLTLFSNSMPCIQVAKFCWALVILSVSIVALNTAGDCSKKLNSLTVGASWVSILPPISWSSWICALFRELSRVFWWAIWNKIWIFFLKLFWKLINNYFLHWNFDEKKLICGLFSRMKRVKKYVNQLFKL